MIFKRKSKNEKALREIEALFCLEEKLSL